MNNEILNKLVKRTVTYLKNDLGFSILNYNFKIESTSKLRYNEITSFIHLSTSIKSNIAFSVSYSFAKELIKKAVYGLSDDDLTEELILENVSETLNITLGNIIKELNDLQSDKDIEISTPSIKNKIFSIENKNIDFVKIPYKNDFILMSFIIE